MRVPVVAAQAIEIATAVVSSEATLIMAGIAGVVTQFDAKPATLNE
jgi:hypothetical protein